MADLSVRKHDDFLMIELNRPAAGNSLNDGMLSELEDLLRDDSHFGDVQLAVFTGSGGKFFCAGGDVAYLSTLSVEHVVRFTFRARQVLLAIERLPIRTVAAIDGFAIGGGLEVALACDYRLARRSATLSMPHVSLGLIPGWHGVERLRRVVGHRVARDVLFTASSVPAEVAQDIGLIDGVVHDDEDWPVAIQSFLREQIDVGRSGRSAVLALRTALHNQDALQAEDATLAAFADLWESDAHRAAEARFASRARK